MLVSAVFLKSKYFHFDIMCHTFTRKVHSGSTAMHSHSSVSAEDDDKRHMIALMLLMIQHTEFINNYWDKSKRNSSKTAFIDKDNK